MNWRLPGRWPPKSGGDASEKGLLNDLQQIHTVMRAGAVISLPYCLLGALSVADDDWFITLGVALKCTEVLEHFNLSRRDSNDDLANLNANYLSTEGADYFCNFALFANTTHLARNRSETALETADFLKAGWQCTKGRFREIFCPLQDAPCEWDNLGKLRQYFESLDRFLSKFYDAFIAAIYEASEKLAQGKVPEQFNDVCTPVNISVLTCELKRIGIILGEACGNYHIKIPSECDGNSWPIGYVRELRQECWWPTIAGRHYNFTKIRTVASFLASRLPYLITAQGLCGGRPPFDHTERSVVGSISGAVSSALDEAANAYLSAVGPKIINEAADAYGEVGWPTMYNDTAKYQKLAAKIEENFERDYGGFPSGSEVRRYIMFYPCEENSFAMLRHASTEKMIVLVRRPDVNAIIRRREGLSCMKTEQEWVSKHRDNISLAYMSNGKTATERLQGVDKLMQELGYRVAERSCFRAVVAIECAYTFVWYELGYRYFSAWYGDGNLVMVSLRASGVYRYSSAPVCADVIFVGWET